MTFNVHTYKAQVYNAGTAMYIYSYESNSLCLQKCDSQLNDLLEVGVSVKFIQEICQHLVTKLILLLKKYYQHIQMHINS